MLSHVRNKFCSTPMDAEMSDVHKEKLNQAAMEEFEKPKHLRTTPYLLQKRVMRSIQILLLFTTLSFSQNYDFSQCNVNIVDNDSITLQYVNGYNTLVHMQSGTFLEIHRFEGEMKFVHGFKALEESPNYDKPTLKINKCTKGHRLKINHRRINVILGKSCIERRNIGIIQILSTGN